MKINFHEEYPYVGLGMPRTPFPLVPVKLIGKRGLSVSTYALLDTGADGSLFHADWATRIGLDLLEGRYDTLHGIDPDMTVDCYYHRIDLEVGSYRMRCDVAFSEHIGDDISDNLIGRDTVFDKLRFAFRQKIERFYIGNIP